MSQVFIGIAGLIHFYIFVMESLLWGRPRINRVFGMSAELAENNRVFAFNQGFYNLFLSVAALAGIGFSLGDNKAVGITLMVYAAMSMLGASIVLLLSQRKLFRAALIQGVPPMLGLIFMYLV